MKPIELLCAMTYINSSYILSAQKRMGYLPEEARPSKPLRAAPLLRKALALAAALMIAVSVLFITALAVSEDFREYVFRFFRVEQTEVVPEYDRENGEALFAVEQENVDIGGVIRGTYVHTPAASHARSGIFSVCTDETEMNSGNHYDAYALENGSFVKLEEQWFDREITVQGVTVPMKFEWTEHDGNVAVTYVDADAPYRLYGLSGSADSVLADVYLPGEYPVLLNLRTGEATDVLSGTGAETLGGIANAALTEDRTKMLLITYPGEIYLADLKEKTLLSVDALSGERVEECTVTGNTLVCWTLDGASIQEAALGTLRAWNIDLETMERRELFAIPATPATSHDVWSEYQGDVTFDEAGNLVWVDKVAWSHAGIQFLDGFNQTIHWGNLYAGSCFAVEVDQTRNVYVIDLQTGEKTVIPGYLWPETSYPLLECSPSPDGKKLLLYDRSTGHVGTVGVLDFEKKCYYEFDRENEKNVDEHLVYWFDHDSIIVTAENGSLIQDYYVYRLTDTQ